MQDACVDVCVIGAGPAGSAVAQRLASLGHSVALLEAHAFPRQHLGESLAASVWPLLEVLGVRPAVESAGFLQPTGTLLRWSGPIERREGFGEPGLQVDRCRFDAILLEAARSAGTRVIQPARVQRTQRQGDRRVTTARTATGLIEIPSRFIVDAAGRSGWLGGRKQRTGPRTLALAAYWTCMAGCGAEARVEAGEQQWYWAAPLPDGRAVAAAFVDAAAYRLGIRAFQGRDRLYEHLVSQSELLRACLGRRVTSVLVCDASPCHDGGPATADTIKVGEAAFAIDPLSSQGVQTAIGSALHAAAVVHTILVRPGNTAAAIEFYRAAQDKAVAFHQRAAAAAYAEAAATRAASFWHERAAPHHGTVQHPANTPEPLTRTRTVRLADGVRVETAPVLRGDVIVSGSHVVLPNGRGPVAFLDGVELAPLLDPLRQPVTIGEVIEAWANRMSRDRSAAILDWLWATGALRDYSGSLEVVDNST